jgi:hypothetical protein
MDIPQALSSNTIFAWDKALELDLIKDEGVLNIMKVIGLDACYV